MKKSLLACAAVLVASIPLSSFAQTTGSRPGVFDVTNTSGWVQIQSNDPSVRQWAHVASAARAGTNCNIVSSAIPASNAELQAAMDTIDEQTLLTEMRKSGVNFIEISPIQTADMDDVDAFRITTRISASGQLLTAFQMQAIIRGNLLAVTCGSLEASFGEMAPTLERFIDDIQFGSNLVTAGVQTELDTEFPKLLVSDSEAPIEFAVELMADSAGRLMEASVSE